jgi:(1->4)-alpha-D-glucan 1-alpha-D-glucosylmutase
MGALEPSERPWLATYRLQLNADFTFDDVAAIAPYLAELGISHVYFSPVLQAAPGSTHGYDVADTTRLSDDLGGPQAYERACEALAEHGIGQMWDIVPNHMAAGDINPWWSDVLRNGRSSEYAPYFDLRWQPGAKGTPDYIRLPVLGADLESVLTNAELRLTVEDGEPVVRYYGTRFPLSPETAPHAGIEAYSLNSGLLLDLLERQHYRLVYWRDAEAQMDYRRFFDINGLAGVRVEDPQVFDATHRIVLEQAAKRRVQGLRVDHIDGLRDPIEYLLRLRNAAPNARILVEKILDGDEQLSQRWPIDGTTGYDFLSTVNSLFVDPRAEAQLSALYTELTGESSDYAALLENRKRFALTNLLHADVAWLATLFGGACPDVHVEPSHVEAALREIIVSMPVYRTYAQPERGDLEDGDRALLTTAINTALARLPGVTPALFRALRSLLLMERRDQDACEFVLAFQQVSGPAMAKGAEDTAFYTANRLVSLNEVGGNPARFGATVASFHKLASAYAERWPGTMLSTATHDTKRGEDTRLRIAALSEVPHEWSILVRGWMQGHEAYKTNGAPDDNTRYLLYQTLAGAWPADEERIGAYMLKAVREAKVYTSWVEPNEAYEGALQAYVSAVLANESFQQQCAALVDRLDSIAQLSSLSQTLLKLTAPGIPDFYQGAELWDWSLVDPDNRRPVDYETRLCLLREVQEMSPSDVLARMNEALPKLWLIWKTLELREDSPELFRGSYTPALASGPNAECIVAFVRAGRLLTVVPRLTQRFTDEDETTVAVPAGKWRNALTNARVKGGDVPVKTLLTGFPVALLVKEAAS